MCRLLTAPRAWLRHTTARLRSATVRPRLTTARPRPATARLCPATARPRPATARPRPATARPRPATARPRLATARPRPATAEVMPRNHAVAPRNHGYPIGRAAASAPAGHGGTLKHPVGSAATPLREGNLLTRGMVAEDCHSVRDSPLREGNLLTQNMVDEGCLSVRDSPLVEGWPRQRTGCFSVGRAPPGLTINNRGFRAGRRSLSPRLCMVQPLRGNYFL
jgi:hypothetical protein